MTIRLLTGRIAGAGLMAALGLVAAMPAPAASASARLTAITVCQPSISHVSAFAAVVTAPNVTVRGNCFGTGHPFTAGDSIYFRITDVGPNGTLAEVEHPAAGTHSWWSACSSRIDIINGAPNAVTCTITSWTNSSISFYSFAGIYYGPGSYSVKKKDKLVIEVWNHQTGAGPAYGFVTAVGGSASPVKSSCKPSITHISAFKAEESPDVTVQGTCLGSGGAFSATDSPYFRISDLGPTGTPAEIEHVTPGAPHSWWNACSSRTDLVNGSPNGVTCTVTSWTNTSITFTSFGGYYGSFNYSVKPGDKLAIQIWNVQSAAGPAIKVVTAL